ncbi:hypothetical protein [Qipengyuania mesophila]|uniref:hypothetical protein n=1 Tax=Qipengyuania mesophila TaxID=2867246 RepID=UPI0035144004
MRRLRISIHSHNVERSEDFTIEALDIATALTVAEINVAEGDAEIWDGGHCLARLSKHGEGQAVFWRVN